MGNKASQVTRVGAQRLGHEYQDLIAIELLIDWLGHSSRYQWVQLEADNFGALDDVVALNSDNRLVVKQVKFSNHPDRNDDPWTWNTFLQISTENSTSLLRKWSQAFNQLSQNWQIEDASLVSNRRASTGLDTVLDATTALVNFDLIEDELRQEIVREIGDEAHARKFFKGFKFRLNQSNLWELEERLKRTFIDQLHGTELGWNNLRQTVRKWVAYKNVPNFDGKILLGDIQLAARWNMLHDLSQEFELPHDYVPPSEQFHQSTLDRLTSSETRCLVVTANPGIGKSSYCSYLYKYLRDQKLPVLRHHYFLSTVDTDASLRLGFERAAESLLHDLIRDYKISLANDADVNPNPNRLREYIQVSGAHFAGLSQKLIIIVDGLDHVWREKRSIEELTLLLDQLLPTPTGVTVFLALQPLDDDILPASLQRYAPRQNWLTLSTLNAEGIDEWLQHNRHVVPHDNNVVDAQIFRKLSDAFFEKSGGHPLYLHYALETLLNRGESISTWQIESLPDIPHNDIDAYYASLWKSLTPTSRSLLHLLAICKFSIPTNGILSCLQKQGVNLIDSNIALQQIKHLLKEEPLGWQPFHSSILVFVRNLPDHVGYTPNLIQAALDWLDNEAPSFLKWGHYWVLQSQTGNKDSLMRGTTREWAVDAFADRRSRRTMRELVALSLHQSIHDSNLARSFEIALLFDHAFFQNNYDFSRDVYEMLLYTQLQLTGDAYLHIQLQTELRDLNNGEVVILAENSIDNPQRIDLCLQELVTRLQRQSQYGSSSWRAIVYPLLQVASLFEGYSPRRAIYFSLQNRENGFSEEMLIAYGRYLCTYKRTQALRASLTENLDLELKTSEKGILQHFTVLHALESGLNIDDILDAAEYISPLITVYRAIYGKVHSQQAALIGFPPANFFSSRKYTRFDSSPPTWVAYYNAFFAFLSNHLLGHEEVNTSWLSGIGDHTWSRRYFHHLNIISAGVAHRIAGRDSFNLEWYYNQVDSFAKPILSYSDDERDLVEAVGQAIEHIGFDCITIFSGFSREHSYISRSDLERTFSSPYCYPRIWMKNFLELRRKWLSHDTLNWLFLSQETQLGKQIERFPDRAEHYATLAAIATIHDHKDLGSRYVRLACENMISHGEHKDTLFFHILESISVYHHASLQNDSAREVAQQSLLKIVPPVVFVDQYTDGDETNALPPQLAETIAKVTPDILPNYYYWLCAREEYYDASRVFNQLIQYIDLSNPLNRSIAKTAIDKKSILILKRRADTDDDARMVLEELLTYFGHRVLEQYEDEANPTYERPASNKESPNPAEYPPERFLDYVSALNEQYSLDFNESISRWMAYWIQGNRNSDVYEAVQRHLDREGRFSNFDELFALAVSLHGWNNAYKWLVKAHIEDSGWHQYWSGKERAVKRWTTIKEYYPDKWFDFIQQTIVSKWNGEISLDHFNFVRIVEYCLFMGQNDLAEQLVQTMVDAALKYVPVQLPELNWIQHSDNRTVN